MTWTAELLPSPPMSGSVTEAHFDSDIEDKEPWVWVNFRNPSAEHSWAGCFRSGFFSCTMVEVLAEIEDAFVVVGGHGYWVSLSDRALRYQERFIAAAKRVPGTATVVVADYVRAALLSAKGPVWRTDDFSLDGITINSVTQSIVMGTAEEPGGSTPYEIDLPSGVVRGGWRRS